MDVTIPFQYEFHGALPLIILLPALLAITVGFAAGVITDDGGSGKLAFRLGHLALIMVGLTAAGITGVIHTNSTQDEADRIALERGLKEVLPANLTAGDENKLRALVSIADEWWVEPQPEPVKLSVGTLYLTALSEDDQLLLSFEAGETSE